MSTRYDVTSPDAKAKIQKWLAEGRKVAVWKSVDLSDLNAGNCYTPGDVTQSPHWKYGGKPHEIVDDIARFRFAKGMREVKRIHISIRIGASGLSLNLTDGSARRLRAALDRVKEMTGLDPYYRFEESPVSREAVIEVPEWED